MDWVVELISGILITAVVYMAFPFLRLFVNHGRFEYDQAKKIALWNSIILGVVFCIITIDQSDSANTWNAAPAVLYYFINRAILTNRNISPNDIKADRTRKSYGGYNVYGSEISLNNTGSETQLGKNTVVEQSDCLKQELSTTSRKTLIVILFALSIAAVLIFVAIISAISRDVSDSLDNESENDYIPIYEEIGVSVGQYTIATIISDDPEIFCEYVVELEFTLSKGTYGDDLKIEKATEYLNNLPLEYGQKIIMFRMIFLNNDQYNYDIVEYLNSRDDISRSDMEYVLVELGFAVFSDGTIKW